MRFLLTKLRKLQVVVESDQDRLGLNLSRAPFSFSPVLLLSCSRLWAIRNRSIMALLSVKKSRHF